MVLTHIAKRSYFVIESSSLPYSCFFKKFDLYPINILIVPKRFKNRIRETKSQYILHSLAGKIMVDSENLLFSKETGELVI